jgi:hypothetical protein
MSDAMSGNGGGDGESRTGWLKTMFWSLATATALLTAGLGAQASAVESQPSDYRSAVSAAWQEFAKQSQSRSRQWLAADDE